MRERQTSAGGNTNGIAYKDNKRIARRQSLVTAFDCKMDSGTILLSKQRPSYVQLRDSQVIDSRRTLPI